jgi:hypothetical protein
MIHLIKSIISRQQNWSSKNYEKTKYGKTISKLKETQSRKMCFIIGNGPSLTGEDLNRLQELGIPTFAMNRVFNIFPKTKWRPTYYVSEDILILRDTISEVDKIPARIKFIPINLHWYNGIDIENACYFNMDYSSELRETFGLSLDCSHSIRCRGTVTTTCIQLAIYMGFKEIYLLGIDHNYSKVIDLNGDVVENKDVKDYFVDNYDADIKDQVVHDMRAPTKAFRDVEQLSRKLGTFKVFNATRGGKLEIFERVDFDALMKRLSE